MFAVKSWLRILFFLLKIGLVTFPVVQANTLRVSHKIEYLSICAWSSCQCRQVHVLSCDNDLFCRLPCFRLHLPVKLLITQISVRYNPRFHCILLSLWPCTNDSFRLSLVQGV